MWMFDFFQHFILAEGHNIRMGRNEKVYKLPNSTLYKDHSASIMFY